MQFLRVQQKSFFPLPWSRVPLDTKQNVPVSELMTVTTQEIPRDGTSGLGQEAWQCPTFNVAGGLGYFPNGDLVEYTDSTV